MSVSRDVIANVEECKVEEVCCQNCIRYSRYPLFDWCVAWDLSIKNANEDFCSFFVKREENR